MLVPQNPLNCDTLEISFINSYVLVNNQQYVPGCNQSKIIWVNNYLLTQHRRWYNCYLIQCKLTQFIYTRIYKNCYAKRKFILWLNGWGYTKILMYIYSGTSVVFTTVSKMFLPTWKMADEFFTGVVSTVKYFMWIGRHKLY